VLKLAIWKKRLLWDFGGLLPQGKRPYTQHVSAKPITTFGLVISGLSFAPGKWLSTKD
jgi:hypothetical protein